MNGKTEKKPPQIVFSIRLPPEVHAVCSVRKSSVHEMLVQWASSQREVMDALN